MTRDEGDRIDEQMQRAGGAPDERELLGEAFDAENGLGASDELLRLAAENTGLPACPFCGGELCAVVLAEDVGGGPGVSCGGCGAYTSAAMARAVAVRRADFVTARRGHQATPPGSYHPDPEINAEVVEQALEAERIDLAAGYAPRFWRCPCGRGHSRGHFQAIGIHRCLGCGYVGEGGTMHTHDADGRLVV